MAFRFFLTAAALFSCIAPASAQPASHSTPKLAIMLDVDGLTSDQFTRYRASFTGGLAKLARGILFTNATPAGGTTLPPASVTMSVPNGGRAGGQAQTWSWNGRQFASTTAQPASRFVPVANQAISMMVARAEPALVPPPACVGLTPGTRFARAAGDHSAFSASPAMDGAVLAVGAGLAQEARLGVDSSPDLLILRLPATGKAAAGHPAGSDASCLQLLALDRDLGSFFDHLDRAGVDYVVALTNGSGTAPAPLMFWRRGMAQAEVAAAVSTADVMPTIAAMLGTTVSPAAQPGRCLRQVAGAACQR